MKTFTLIIAATLFFASCEKPTAECIEVTDPNIPVDDDCITFDELDEFEHKFDVAQTQVRSNGDDKMDSLYVEISLFSYPADLYWTIDIERLWGSNETASNQTAKIFHTYDGTGFFDFNFVHTWLNGTQDTIFGSGYFDLDTFYVNYDYIKLTDETIYGSVNIHSY